MNEEFKYYYCDTKKKTRLLLNILYNFWKNTFGSVSSGLVINEINKPKNELCVCVKVNVKVILYYFLKYFMLADRLSIAICYSIAQSLFWEHLIRNIIQDYKYWHINKKNHNDKRKTFIIDENMNIFIVYCCIEKSKQST